MSQAVLANRRGWKRTRVDAHKRDTVGRVFSGPFDTESFCPRFHQVTLEGGLTVPGDMGSGPLPVQPYPTEDVLRVGLSRGVSMSLPSSPMLPPRQPYMLPLRPSTKSSGTITYSTTLHPHYHHHYHHH
ncbi:protein TANC1 isoform X1, partial [Tachysurus ichikawai]